MVTWGAHIRGISLKGAYELVPNGWKETSQPKREKVRVFPEKEIENLLGPRAELKKEH